MLAARVFPAPGIFKSLFPPKALKCTQHATVSTVVLGCFFERDRYSVSRTLTLGVSTVSDSVARVPLLVSAGRSVEKRTSSTKVLGALDGRAEVAHTAWH